MSEYTREEILKLIEENGGPEKLDLSGKDLSGIDLSAETITAELKKAREGMPDKRPVWCGMSYKYPMEGINLQGANLQGANLEGTNLRGASLVGANLKGARLVRVNLQGSSLPKANLERAVLLEANLSGTLLMAANFKAAVLVGANLKWAMLEVADLQEAVLEGANLQGADLRYSHLEKADFFPAAEDYRSAAGNLEGAHFYNATLDNTRMRREQLRGAIGEELDGRYDEAKEAYLALKNNFAEIGRYRDESWAYVKERKMGKMMNHPRSARKYCREELPENPNVWRLVWFYVRHAAKWQADWFVELLCGYGESLWRVLAWMLLVILGFAAYYQVSHAVVTSSQDAAISLWDHLMFSLGAFTTLQPTRLQAARPGVELLTTIQAIIGISLAGLLGFVAGNRIRRS